MADLKPKKVIIKKPSGAVEIIDLKVSPRDDVNWHYPKHSDGFHFDNLENVESFFQGRHPESEIEIK